MSFEDARETAFEKKRVKKFAQSFVKTYKKANVKGALSAPPYKRLQPTPR